MGGRGAWLAAAVAGADAWGAARADLGAGLFATRGFGEGERVLSVPKALVVHLGSAGSSRVVRAVLRGGRVPECVHAKHLLLLFLAFCRENSTDADAAAWKPYFDALPRQFDNLPCWSDEELAWLAGTNAQEAARRARTELRKVFEFLDFALQQRAEDEPLRVSWCVGAVDMARARARS